MQNLGFCVCLVTLRAEPSGVDELQGGKSWRRESQRHGSIRALGLRSSGKFRAAVLREPGAIARVIRSRRYCLRLRRFSPTLRVSVDTRALGPADFLSPSLYGAQQQYEY